MTAARIFTDADVYASVAPALRGAGFDAISSPEAGRLGESDESQLRWAAERGRTLVSFNVGDFARLHAQWTSAGRGHAGIVVSSQRSVGETLARLLRLVRALDQDALRDRLEFLSDW